MPRERMDDMTNGDANRRLHFIGIGGSSMSGLAHLMLERGFQVTGSDRTASHKTESLRQAGARIFIGQAAENVRGADLVVYSAAISPDNPERAEAARLGIPQIERADMLGRLMEGYQSSICVSGTHGKTTTTSMIAQVFVEAGEQPTVHIGGDLPALGGGTREGNDNVFIAEACEFNGSFLKFKPTVAVVLNIDEDHLDYYRDIDDIEAAFARYVGLVPEDGWAVGWGDDARVRRVLDGARCQTRTFGLGRDNDVRAEQLIYDEVGNARFLATLHGHPLMEVSLRVAGEHNVVNALAAIAVADLSQLPASRVAATLSRFTGAHRRFELTGVVDGVRLFTDYSHNPTEIKNALRVAKLQPHGRLWAVWQPHTYSRTKKLFDGFMDTFGDADIVVVTDIMGAREADPGDINSQMLVDGLRRRGVDARLTPSFDDAEAHLRANWLPGDLVVTLGCGDIDLLNEQIHNRADR
ncbi:MAG: UDP-N-acetylmuramate--L-alanine ligase [Clostridiales bacterium]|nr:UDP-N-acetylmuramate--L-alanine ligase [Clostridiales bacterium]